MTGSIARPRYHMFAGAKDRDRVVIPVRHEAAIR
jgi:hypothetical protein